MNSKTAPHSSVEYRSSQKTLDELCTIDPDEPIKYGAGKLAGGISLLAGFAAVAYITYQYVIDDLIIHGWDTEEKIIGGVLAAIGAGVGGAAAYFGFNYSRDGVMSLLDRASEQKDGTYYYHNGGYTNTPSNADREYGTKITPVESTSQLSYIEKGQAFINGFVISKTDLTSEERVRMIPMTISTGKTSTTVMVPHPYTVYFVSVEGTFHDVPVTANLETETKDFAKTLADKDQGSAIYLRGEYADSRIIIEEYGDAMEG